MTLLWVFGAVELELVMNMFANHYLLTALGWVAGPYIKRWFYRIRRSCEVRKEKEVQGEKGISPPAHSTV
ncbi:hypothetical protein FVEN_g12635 [Fusarium venenatum]|uniref:Uncharacterized protein n=1 Tax=Fusarium venenatum TaxID=56646 RepID=A0A2L2TSV0_9HYPO|nr:uncharacterized protein FVRRES_07471 [Fusarium venenatum]KAG8362058.1 hypothetical protein FVEN_g12635 [Fusarium venenatum]CEI63035.1 unnamed protein product [Fusarium venenatum]